MKNQTSRRFKCVLLTLGLLASLSSFTGCLSQSRSSGNPIDTAKVAQIVKGKTTRAEVEALLGKPEVTVMLGDGKRSLSYTYVASDMHVNPATMFLGPLAHINGETRTQSLQITVGKDGIVEDYELSDGTRELSGSVLNTQSTTR